MPICCLVCASCGPSQDDPFFLVGAGKAEQGTPSNCEPYTDGWRTYPRKCAVENGTVLLPQQRPVQGFDVSIHQGRIDWDKVRVENMTFAIARVSDGLYTPDGDLFVRNYQGIAKAGLIRGAYQFLRPEQDAAAQAQLFLDAISEAGGIGPHDLPPILDIEVHHDPRTKRDICRDVIQSKVRQWLDIVGPATNTLPIIYTMAGGSEAVGESFGNHRLWVANFYQKCPRMPKGWDDWDFHQYTDSGRVPGIRGKVDLDIFNGTREQLEQLIALRGHRPADAGQ